MLQSARDAVLEAVDKEGRGLVIVTCMAPSQKAFGCSHRATLSAERLSKVGILRYSAHARRVPNETT